MFAIANNTLFIINAVLMFNPLIVFIFGSYKGEVIYASGRLPIIAAIWATVTPS